MQEGSRKQMPRSEDSRKVEVKRQIGVDDAGREQVLAPGTVSVKPVTTLCHASYKDVNALVPLHG